MGRKQNVILLTIDCLRPDHIGCYGYSRKVSPNIDYLARKGVLFSQAISNGPATAWSFPSILTSTYPLIHPLREVRSDVPFVGIPYLSEQKATIAEVLKEKGYSTAAFHFNPYISSYWNYNRGFDAFEEIRPPIYGHNLKTKIKSHARHIVGNVLCSKFDALEKPWNFIQNLIELISARALMRGLGKTERAYAINQRAIAWLRVRPRYASDNFFLWLHYMDAHPPYLPPKCSLQHMRVVKLNLKWKNSTRTNANAISRDELEAIVNLYDQEIKGVDYALGLLFKKLKEMGIWLDNTFIILTADHGDAFKEHGLLGHSPNQSRAILYDELIHVPLIICGPEIEEEVVIEDQVSLLDLSPTIVDLLNIGKVESFQGISLLTHIKGRKEQKKTGIISEYVNRDGKEFYSYRTENWKYILTLEGQKKQCELYDLRNDPKEKRNIAKEEREKVMEFEAKILEHRSMEKETRRISSDEKKKIILISQEEEIKKRLNALGYT